MRKRKPKLKGIEPDPRYNDPNVTMFVNNLMFSGKKSLAYNLFYQAMDIIDEKTEEGGYETWKKALDSVMPQVEVRSRRIGGATFQIPTEIQPKRKIVTGMKWIIRFARQRNGRSYPEKLAAEIMAAAKGEGAAVRRKEEVHRMAESNRAFAHFRV